MAEGCEKEQKEFSGEFIDKILVYKKGAGSNSDEQIIDIVSKGVGILNNG